MPRVLLAVFALCLWCTSAASEAPRVRVGEVEFSGIATADGGAAFLGMPFAAPPVGALRWAPPMPWKANATARDATAFASGCMQNERMVEWYRDVVRTFDGDPAVVATPRFDEDCLYLNVWTPERLPKKPLPVIVWIHGGSNTGGWSFEPNYHGEALARQGVVVVSIAYRLGVFGFFSLPELPQSNFALLDQIAALQWIQAHIGAFGGDPARVTVAGESAGASNITSMMASKRASGLFTRAVVQSGAYVLHSRATREQAITQGLALARAVGARTDAEALATLRGLSGQQLQDAVDAMKGTDFDPVVDGDTVTEAPRDAIAAGRMNRVDLLAGSNDDEWLMYLEPPLDEAAWLAKNAAGREDTLRTALAGEQDPMRRMDLLETAKLFVCPSLWLAGEVRDGGAKAWVYHFTRVREGAGGQRIGAYHGAEIPYMFGTHDAWLPTADGDREISARMMRYWSRFAATGDPNGAGDPAWPAFSPREPGVLRLDATPSTLPVHPSAALCGVLAPVAQAGVDGARIAEPAAGDWPAHGRDYAEQRFSPLKGINADNVTSLGLEWFFEMPDRIGLEATPVVADGVMFVSGGWSRIYALDARTGALLWQHDPQVDRSVSYRFCCGAVNRGVALWGENVYSATLDGRLIALNRANGRLLWSSQTTDTSQNYSITGAPRVINGKVIIGNGGAEHGVRGYVSAYDAGTGEMAWRFYTVPGNPALGFENTQMELAARTWNGEWWTLGGGGGTVWDSMAYDPELNLLYIGVGNGGPHNRRLRSPGGGDNLFLSSIVALNADTGAYAWHYQETPAENWDYTATQHIVVADIEWEGKPRKVLLHAPKNGFFFVIDRVTGALLSAKPYTEVNWASGYDMATGRPIENPGKDYATEMALVKPSGVGGHNWPPMAYSPRTGLVYIPTIKLAAQMKDLPLSEFIFHDRHWNLGYTTPETPDNPLLQQALLRALSGGALLAWDPVRQQEAWQVEHSMLGNGGVLATDGGLVFQGTADASFSAYEAGGGRPVWSFKAQNGIVAAPISYEIDGEQYIAVAAGRGGGTHMVLGVEHEPRPNGRVLVFKLGGSATLPEFVPPSYPTPPPIEIVEEADLANGKVTQEQIERGNRLYHEFCYRCHGTSGVSDGELPDLRRLDPAWHRDFNKVLLEGLMEQAGMPRFDDVLTPADADAIHAWVLHKANQDHAFRNQPAWWLGLQKWFYAQLAALVALIV